MSFEVSKEAYDRMIGRWAAGLAKPLADLAGVAPGQRAVDVGCGPGALTAELVDRLGEEAVAAVDPSATFVGQVREQFPRVDVREAVAESLPWEADAFDAALAQLVVHFMADPVRGLREMARVTAPGGAVAACVWDHAGGRSPQSTFWKVASRVTEVAGEAIQAGSTAGDHARLLGEAGLVDVEETEIAVRADYPTFADWWEPYTLGVGTTGDFVRGLSGDVRERLRLGCAEVLGGGPLTVEAVAWAGVGRVR